MKSFKTFSTVLEDDNAKEIIEYFEETAGSYGCLKRSTLHILRNCPEISRNDLNKLLQERFSVTTRTANSAIYEVEEIIDSALALIPLNIEKLEAKIEGKIKLIEKKRKEMVKIHASRKTNAKRLGKLKLHIYNIHNSINRMKQKIENLERQLNEKKPDICMGTKKLARNDIKAFKLHRDSQINYIGRAREKQGNLNFQMQYIKKGNFFTMKVRRDFGKWKDDRSPERFAYGKCHFKYGSRQLRDAMKDNASPVTVSIIRKNDRYYLFVAVVVSYESSRIVTRKEHGVIGIDFNKGFVNICETDGKGNVVRIEKMKYPFGKAGNTNAGLADVISKVCKKAVETGKSIVAEDLSFERKKRKTKKAVTPTEKERMRMLHSLPYSRYAQILGNLTFNRKIELIKVNPAYTSRTAEQKFCDQMKLNIHNGAAYVIARKGMGIKDSLKKTG